MLIRTCIISNLRPPAAAWFHTCTCLHPSSFFVPSALTRNTTVASPPLDRSLPSISPRPVSYIMYSLNQKDMEKIIQTACFKYPIWPFKPMSACLKDDPGMPGYRLTIRMADPGQFCIRHIWVHFQSSHHHPLRHSSVPPLALVVRDWRGRVLLLNSRRGSRRSLSQVTNFGVEEKRAENSSMAHSQSTR